MSLYRIQVKQKQQEVRQLNQKNQQILEEVQELKRQRQMKERAELTKEVLGENNAETVKHYKKRAQEKEQQVADLTKRLRAYTLQEKRILMKERAYELEREDTLKKLVRVQNEAAIARVYKGK